MLVQSGTLTCCRDQLFLGVFSHLSLSFHMELTRPFGKVDFQEITSRHWERGAQLFWLPQQFADNETLDGLKSYFNFFVAGRDLLDIFADQMHRLNTPAVVALKQQKFMGANRRWNNMLDTLLPWLKEQKNHAIEVFEKKSMIYSLAIVKYLWNIFENLEGLNNNE